MASSEPLRGRLIQDGAHSGEFNMAADVYLTRSAQTTGDVILRLYTWECPTLSLGYHQRITSEQADRCRRQNVPVVRRPTGGRAVLHDRELTYAIAIPAVHPLLIMGRSAILRDIGSAFVAAGRMIGLQAKLFRSGSRLANHESSRRGNPLCFEAISRWEVHLNGRKWIGSAQRFLPEAFLQHGSILIGKNTHDIAEMLDVHSQAKTSDNFQINEQDLRRTIPKAIAERWNLIWRDEGFTAEELAQMEVT